MCELFVLFLSSRFASARRRKFARREETLMRTGESGNRRAVYCSVAAGRLQSFLTGGGCSRRGLRLLLVSAHIPRGVSLTCGREAIMPTWPVSASNQGCRNLPDRRHHPPRARPPKLGTYEPRPVACLCSPTWRFHSAQCTDVFRRLVCLLWCVCVCVCVCVCARVSFFGAG